MNEAHDCCGGDDAGMHQGDTYNPVDPTLPARLTPAGFHDVDVRTNEFGWAAAAHR